jgi:hypothetical protein
MIQTIICDLVIRLMLIVFIYIDYYTLARVYPEFVY